MKLNKLKRTQRWVLNKIKIWLVTYAWNENTEGSKEQCPLHFKPVIKKVLKTKLKSESRLYFIDINADNSTYIKTRNYILYEQNVTRWLKFKSFSDSWIYNSLISNLWISNSLIANSLISNSLISNSLIFNSLISNSLISNSMISNSLISNSWISNLWISNWLIFNSLISNSLISNLSCVWPIHSDTV